ncbi:MAG: hypothetical protein DWQ05_04565 [Calditrichaeota bacterium]|nr:MAG: hypothetical protein DWQ05_04565 [Calditrichota bacterium]
MTEQNDNKFDNLKSKLQQNPDSVVFARVAEALLVRGKVDEAIRISEEGIRKHPYYVTGHMVLGKCYLQKKMFDLAEKEFKRVLLFEPKYIAAHKFTGDLMKEAGWSEACEKSYAEILKIDPHDNTIRQTLETIKRDVASEQMVVSPAEGSLPKPIAEESPGFQPDITSFEESEMAESVIGETPDAQPIETTSINIDDDLFADDPPKSMQEIEKIEISDSSPEGVTSILDDIFEDSTPEEAQKDNIAAEENDIEENDVLENEPDKPESKAIPEVDVLDGIQVKPYDPDAPEVEPDHAVELNTDASQTDQSADLPLPSGDETIEFNKIESPENAALENLKPMDDSELEFISQAKEGEAEGQDFFDALDAEFDNTDASGEEAKPESAGAEEKTDEAPVEVKPANEETLKADPEPLPTSESTAEQIFDDVFGNSPESSETNKFAEKLEAPPAEQEAQLNDNIEEFDIPIAKEEPEESAENETLKNESEEALQPVSIPEISDEKQETPAALSDSDDSQIVPDLSADAIEQDELDLMIAAVEEASSDKSTKTTEFEKPDIDEPETTDESTDSSTPEVDRDRIVTPTLGEIYAAQGQYGKAMNVFEVLLKKDPENKAYQDKVSFLKQRMSESPNA